MQTLESSTCHTKALPRCHTDSPCHTERSEVSIMESRFFANAQNDKKTDNPKMTKKMVSNNKHNGV